MIYWPLHIGKLEEETKAATKHIGNFAAAVAILVVLQVLISHFYLHVPITLAGERIRVRRDSTISALLRSQGIRVHSGDLMSVRGKVLQQGKGKDPYVIVDGRGAAFSSTVRGGANISPRNGEDVTEPIITRKVAIPPETKVVGTGRYLAINAQGVAGVRLDYFGALSKVVTKREVLRAAVPTVLVRTNAAPPKMVALTFDDGPWGDQTLRIAGVLNKYRVPATFFVMGRQVKKYPGILRRLVADGFVIANHSYSHPNLTNLGAADITHELDWTQKIVMANGRRKPYWMRPPGGNIGSEGTRIARALGLHPILWDLDSHDWTKPGVKTLVQTVLTEVRSGYIVLMHDGGGDRTQTLQALPYIIRGLRAKGYSFVTLDDMFNVPPSKSRLPVKTTKRPAKSGT